MLWKRVSLSSFVLWGGLQAMSLMFDVGQVDEERIRILCKHSPILTTTPSSAKEMYTVKIGEAGFIIATRYPDNMKECIFFPFASRDYAIIPLNNDFYTVIKECADAQKNTTTGSL